MSANARSNGFPGDTINQELIAHQGNPENLIISKQNLSGLCFEGLDLSYVVFLDCDIQGTIFRDCFFENSSFSGCVVSDATALIKCDIDMATLITLKNINARAYMKENEDNGIVNVSFQTPLKMCGSFLGYKIAYVKRDIPVIVTLQIPADACSVVFRGDKCRASKVEVLSIEMLEGDILPDAITAYSAFYTPSKSAYHKGCVTIADDFNPRPSDVCTCGIHFFLTKAEAIDFALEQVGWMI